MLVRLISVKTLEGRSRWGALCHKIKGFVERNQFLADTVNGIICGKNSAEENEINQV